jgi:hypothetical protein
MICVSFMLSKTLIINQIMREKKDWDNPKELLILLKLPHTPYLAWAYDQQPTISTFNNENEMRIQLMLFSIVAIIPQIRLHSFHSYRDYVEAETLAYEIGSILFSDDASLHCLLQLVCKSITCNFSSSLNVEWKSVIFSLSLSHSLFLSSFIKLHLQRLFVDVIWI